MPPAPPVAADSELAAVPSTEDLSLVTASSEIKKVVLFNDRAQVFRTGKCNLKKAGDYTITFNGLWNSVNRDTLQVALSPVVGASVILRSVQFTTINEVVDVRPQRRELDEKLKAFEKPLRDVQDEINLADRAIANFEGLKQKLTAQMSSGKSPKGSPFVYDPSLWMKFNDFIKSGNSEHRNKKRDAERRKDEITKDKNEVELALRRLGNTNEKRTSREVAEVILSLLTDKPNQEVTVDMMLSYMVSGASWKPSYDLHINKETKEMSVSYNAVVQQRAGEDWKNVRLELSTAKSHIGGEIPDFTTPWYLKKKAPIQQVFFNDEQELNHQINFMPQSNMMQQMMPQQQQMMMNRMPAAPGGGGGHQHHHHVAPRRFTAATASSASVNTSSSTSATFTIKALSTVLADNEPVKVTIGIFDLPVFFRYSATPKIDPNVYLKVKATNSSEFPMLQGKANIFADEQLVGRSEIDDVAPGEEFWTFLGQDGSVSCTRKELAKKNVDVSGGFLGKDKKRVEYSYKFTCKNSKSTKEELVIWDQMPISDDSRITVSLVTPKAENEGKDPATTGKKDPLFKINDVKYIEWFCNLLPGEERTFDYVFHVEHPAENQVVV